MNRQAICAFSIDSLTDKGNPLIPFAVTVQLDGQRETVVIRAIDAYTACVQAEEMSDALYSVLPRIRPRNT